MPEAKIDRRGDPVATKNRILLAAAEEFSEYGIAGARVARIAAKAKSNKQLIHHYFATKQGLYEAVVDLLVSRVRASIDEERATGIAYLESRQFARETDKAHALWARLLAWEGLAEATESPELEGKRAESFRLLREWVETDQAAGRITSRFSADKVLALSTFARLIPVAMPKVFLLILGMDESTDAEESWRVFISSILAPDCK